MDLPPYPAAVSRSRPGKTNDKEVVAMSENLETDQPAIMGAGELVRDWSCWRLESRGLCIRIAGCRRILPSDGVQLQRSRRKRRRWKRSRSKTRPRCSPRPAITRTEETQRSLNRIKDWEEKCEKEVKAIREGRRVDGSPLSSGETADSRQSPGLPCRPRPGCDAGIGGQGSLN